MSSKTTSEENSYQSVYGCKLSDEFINAPVSESTKAVFFIYGKLKETVELFLSITETPYQRFQTNCIVKYAMPLTHLKILY